MSELSNLIAAEIAAEICEDYDSKLKWPDEFNGDTIDRARSRADKIMLIAAALSNEKEKG